MNSGMQPLPSRGLVIIVKSDAFHKDRSKQVSLGRKHGGDTDLTKPHAGRGIDRIWGATDLKGVLDPPLVPFEVNPFSLS